MTACMDYVTETWVTQQSMQTNDSCHGRGDTVIYANDNCHDRDPDKTVVYADK